MTQPNPLLADAGWTLGYVEDVEGVVSYVEGRDLADEEVASYRAAVAFVLEYREQPLLRLVIGNYREYRAIEASIALAVTTSTPRQGQHADALSQLQRVLLNWLTSVRMLDDHTLAAFTRRYGADSSELRSYEIARRHVYDGNSAYRFMVQLRNYAQHCAQVPVHGHAVVNAAERRMELFFNRDELLERFHNWKIVKRDLLGSPPRIGASERVSGAMNGVLELVSSIAEIDKPHFEQCVSVIAATVGSTPREPGRQPALFRVRKDTSPADALTMDVLPVMVIGKTDRDQRRPATVEDIADKPVVVRPRTDYQCQGPLDRVTHLPAESCSERAALAFYFPHQAGIALMFACATHAMELGQWAGRRFGGCYGGEVDKTAAVMEGAAGRGIVVRFPHRDEFASLAPVAVPAPKTASLFNDSD
jgi:hypothetical protein